VREDRKAEDVRETHTDGEEERERARKRERGRGRGVEEKEERTKETSEVHTSAYVSIRPHTSAYVSIRQGGVKRPQERKGL
jgi:hypothetical protein